MDPITLSIIAGSSALCTFGGYLLGRRSRKYREREQLRRHEEEDRRQQEREFDRAEQEAKRKEREAREAVEKEARDRERERMAESTRAALDFGYTMQQVLDWAYHECWYDDHVPAKRKQEKETYRAGGGYLKNRWVYVETQEEAEARVKQERYEHLRMALTGRECSATMKGRDILNAMITAGIRTSQEIFATISEEAMVESLTAGGVSDSQIMNVANILLKIDEGEKERIPRAIPSEQQEDHEVEAEA